MKRLISAITRERYARAFCLLLAVLIVSIGETNAVENTTQRAYSTHNSSFRATTANGCSGMQMYNTSASYCFAPSSAEETGAGAGYSAYSPAITQVGATQAAQMASTTDDSSPADKRMSGPRRDPGLKDPGQDNRSPVGEAWALLLFGALYLGYTLLHKKKAKPGKS
ncbi:MAG: hypothetical protein ACI30A_07835 [Paludibacteraceae bacterium]